MPYQGDLRGIRLSQNYGPNWFKNETSQNWIFPSSIDAPSLGRIFQVTFSPGLMSGGQSF